MQTSWRIIDLTLAYQIGVMLLGTLSAWLLAPDLVNGVVAGSAIALFHIAASRWVLPRAASFGRVRLGYMLLMFAKFGVTLAMLGVAFTSDVLQPAGLVAGFGGTFFLGIGLALIHMMLAQHKTSKPAL